MLDKRKSCAAYCRALATGVHAAYLFFVLFRVSLLLGQSKVETYVLYGLYPDRLHVSVGLCSFGSQTRAWRCRSLSSDGGLSTTYDIQACLYIVNCCTAVEVLYEGAISHTIRARSGNYAKVSCRLDPRGGDVRIEFVVLVVHPARSHCSDQYTISFIPGKISLRGSSSSKFSKYLLPYLSMAMKVPALVSPAARQHCQSIPIDIPRAYRYAIFRD